MTNEDGYISCSKIYKDRQSGKEARHKTSGTVQTLSFMALPVIPKLKLSDIGLFDGSKFEFVKLKLKVEG